MNPKTVLLAVVAIAITGATFFLMRGWMNSQRTRQPVVVEAKKPEAPKIEILVARNTLPAGYLIKANDLEWRQWPKNGVAPVYVVKGKGDIKAFEGSVVRRGITNGEPVTVGRIIKPGDRGFMAAVLGPGMRAISIRLTPTTGVAGFIFPGDRVDIILSHSVRYGGAKTGRVSETVLTNIRVIALDQKTDDINGKPSIAKTGTFEVTPKQAEFIAVASQIGTLTLSLRSLDAEEGAGSAARRARRGSSFTRDGDVSRLLNVRRETNSVIVLRGTKEEVKSVGKSKGGGTVQGVGAATAGGLSKVGGSK